jgi:hypothetical protein
MEGQIDDLVTEIDSLRATMRKVSGRLGAQVAASRTDPPDLAAHPSDLVPRVREHVPLATILQKR